MSAPVMWKISRVRIDRMGPSAARFLDVTLDFTDAERKPVDSILWLRNGGGKSTVLSLICALIRPARRDFLATAATGKHLEDYVLGADTGHVVVEWSGPGGRLVTGAVYEWADRAQPADPNREHDRLGARWYLFREVDDRVALDRLPLAERLTQKDFVAALRAWDTVPGAGVVVTDRQDRWAQALDEHGLDPAIFNALLQMNATEGGIEGQFQFRNADQFVRYLLELIVDPEVPGQVSQILEKVRAGLAERPELLADQAFATEAVPLVRALAESRDALTGAEEAERALAERAAALAGAIAAGVSRARREEAEHADRAEEIGGEAAEHRDRAALAEARSAALYGLAARYRLAAAQEELARAREAQTRTARAEAAWRGVGELLRLRAARDRVTSLEEQLAAATAEAEPLRVRLAAAAADLARALDAALAEHTARADELDARLAAARETETAARAAVRRSTAEEGRLSGELAAAQRTLADVDESIAAAVRAGHLEADEDVAVAADRHRTADAEAAVELGRLVEERAALRERREELRAATEALVAERRTLTETHTADTARAAELRERAAALAAEERLAALAGGGTVDPVAEAGDLDELLTAAIARTERRRVELAVEGAEDERALDALAATELLPPALDLDRARQAVEVAGIAVTTGWRYLADSVAPARHEAVREAAPALVAGLLVHDPADRGAALEAVHGAGLRPTSMIIVSTTAALQAVVDGEAASAHAVVRPAPALTDRAASGPEITARERARAGRAGADAELAAERERDADLRRRVRDLRADCPPGTLAALDRSIAEAAAGLSRVAADDQRVAQDLAAADAAEEALDARRSAAEEVRRAAAVAGAVLAGLAERLRTAEPVRQRARALPAEIAAARAAGEEAARTEETAQREAREAEESGGATRRALADLRAERDRLGEIGEVGAGPVPDLGEARRAHESAEQAYRREVSDSALAASLAEARRVLADPGGPSAQVAALDSAVRAAAEELLGAPEAVDAPSREAALARAVEAGRAATEAVGERRSAVAAAEAEVARHPEGGDLPDPVPDTVEAALAGAAEAEDERAGHRAAAERSRSELELVGGLRAEARERVTGLAHQGELLGVAPAADVPAAPEPAEPLTVADAREAVVALRERLDATAAAVRRARAALEKGAREIVVWASVERFAQVKPAIRDRFRVPDVAGEIGPVAADLAAELELFAENVRMRLEELEEHKSVVVTAMTGMVRQALRSLARAQSLSELPENLGPWAGHRFLDVGPRSAVETADAVVRDRCARLVDVLTARGAEVPRGQELLWQATNAVVGDGNWRARVLKPSTALALERVSVERMRKWSGGEKVTISLLLFCMVAKLRATSRGRDLPGLGALPLDNPLGKANYVVFLDLQRKVANANGVQLIFLTGVGDMKAVGRFPNVVRMRNAARRGREYVQVAERIQAEEDPVGAIDTTRIHRDDPVLTLL
ncbi:hypothetical protein [Pseudonocardia sp. WMMC193]|uniref:hypothetical protein n=1 Tax=Pseudonocardia sp. WMMC193 TaxID=2911965 RepID=UPI001F1D7262|nr:hypothetical protein [Pseudonocardia sp. WMMC193]MCF7549781.1 hypothetical protein [Pseudonocardia sp. WMMC193]